MFLPDRFVRGECPVCSAADQYGDSCESCGATYSPSELKNPRSVVSGSAPVQKDSEHFFFRLGVFEHSLRRWHAAGHVHENVARKLQEWFDAGLRDWDISRDAPYFGFRIPGTDDKYFYVWVDAPVGYMASFRNLAASPAGRPAGCPSTTTGTRTAAPSCITSSARTSCISIRCSGRRCWRAPASASPPRCTCTAS